MGFFQTIRDEWRKRRRRPPTYKEYYARKEKERLEQKKAQQKGTDLARKNNVPPKSVEQARNAKPAARKKQSKPSFKFPNFLSDKNLDKVASKLQSLQTPRARRIAVYAELAVIAGVFTVAALNNQPPKVQEKTKAKPRQGQLVSFQVNKDSLAKVAYEQEETRVRAAIEADFQAEEKKLNTLYTKELDMYDRDLHDKDSVNSLSAEFAYDEVKKRFSQDSVDLTKKHPGVVFSQSKATLMAVTVIQGKSDTVLTAAMKYKY